MLIVWEEKDVIGGRVVRRPGACEPYFITTVHLDGSTHHGLCSLFDGYIVCFGSKEKVAALLNNEGYVPADMLDERPGLPPGKTAPYLRTKGALRHEVGRARVLTKE